MGLILMRIQNLYNRNSRTFPCVIFEYFVLQVFSEQELSELPHDKTNKMACVPSEDSDQPRHLPSLIRVFTVPMKRACVLSYPLCAQ